MRGNSDEGKRGNWSPNQKARQNQGRKEVKKMPTVLETLKRRGIRFECVKLDKADKESSILVWDFLSKNLLNELTLCGDFDGVAYGKNYKLKIKTR